MDLQLFLMLNGAVVHLGGRTLHYINSTDEWLVEAPQTRYTTTTLYRGDNLTTAQKALKTGERQVYKITK